MSGLSLRDSEELRHLRFTYIISTHWRDYITQLAWKGAGKGGQGEGGLSEMHGQIFHAVVGVYSYI